MKYHHHVFGRFHTVPYVPPIGRSVHALPGRAVYLADLLSAALDGRPAIVAARIN